MSTTRINTAWGTLSRPVAGEFNRLLVDDHRRCEVYVAMDAVGHRLLIVRDYTGVGHTAKSIKGKHLELDLATYGPTTDIFLQLNEPAMSDVFDLLCEDVIEVAKSVPETRCLFDAVSARVHHWQSMFKGSRRQLLSPSERRGLVGELMVLRDLIQPSFNDSSVEFWSGPLEHPHDFELPSGFIECKSGVSRPVTAVEISSFEQLESAGKPIMIIVQELREANNQGEDLNTLVREFGAMLGPLAAEAFYSRVQAAGYFVDGDYDETKYSLGRRRYYRVEGGFPRIPRDTVPPGISRISYVIELAFMAPYEVANAEELLNT